MVLELARGEEDAFVLLLFIYDVELNATQKSGGSIVYWAGWVRGESLETCRLRGKLGK